MTHASLLKFSIITGAVCLMCAAACSSRFDGQQALLNRLDGRGPVILADSNPYLPANRLVAEEMEQHPALARFVHEHGLPTAIEVKHPLTSPTTMDFYYLQHGSRVTFVFIEGEWRPETKVAIPSQIASAITTELMFGQSRGESARAQFGRR